MYLKAYAGKESLLSQSLEDKKKKNKKNIKNTFMCAYKMKKLFYILYFFKRIPQYSNINILFYCAGEKKKPP
jgi:hypothetical protein